jgi:hypothetical protein
MTDKEKQIFLDKKFKVQLDKTIEDYPYYKIDQNDQYPSELAGLNGTTNKIKELQSNINKKILNLERSIKQQSNEINNYKTIESNLKNMTSIEDLDATSKQMLADSVSEYRQYTIVFWIKVIFILVIIADLVRYKRMDRAIFIIGTFLALKIIYIIYKYVKN